MHESLYHEKRSNNFELPSSHNDDTKEMRFQKKKKKKTSYITCLTHLERQQGLICKLIIELGNNSWQNITRFRKKVNLLVFGALNVLHKVLQQEEPAQ